MADITADQIDSHNHHPTGWRRFLYSTNHKDIGTHNWRSCWHCHVYAYQNGASLSWR